MNSDPTSPQTGRATWLYRQSLKLYPAAFRRRYEEEMLLLFTGEWQRVSAEGVASQCRYTFHLTWDFLSTVLHEWTLKISRLTLMTLTAVTLGAWYLWIGPLPFFCKVLGCAALTVTFAVALMAIAGRSRGAQLKLAALGLPAGLVLGSLSGLNPALLPSPESPVVPSSIPALVGSEIYQRMRAVYANARTYVDQGEEQTVYSGAHAFVQTKPFRTAFVRGGGFRYEFRDQFSQLSAWRDYVIWKDGAKVNSWWAIQPAVREEKNLSHALAGAQGISGSTSAIIPALLQPETGPGFLPEKPTEILLLGTQRVGGCESFVLTLRARNMSAKIWIDARSYLIERIAPIRSLFRNTLVDETIVYRPQINGDVSPAALTYQPPPVAPSWSMWIDGQIYVMLCAAAVPYLITMLNATHRRLLRKKWGGKEGWLTPITKRTFAGSITVITVSLGMWLAGTQLEQVGRNLFLSYLTLRGGVSLYAIHLRSRGYTRFAVAR